MENKLESIKMKSTDKARMELIEQKYCRAKSKKLSDTNKVEDSIILNVLNLEVLKTNLDEIRSNTDNLQYILQKDITLNLEQIDKLNYIPEGTNKVKSLKIVNKYFIQYDETLVAIYKYLSEIGQVWWDILLDVNEIIEGKRRNLNLKDIWNLSLGYEMLLEINYCMERIEKLESSHEIWSAFRNSGITRYYSAFELNLENGNKPYGLSLYNNYYNKIIKNYNMIVGLDKTSPKFNVDKDKKIYEYVKDFIDYKH